ncbi:hypothetical protein COLSTE_02261 [Collinsella stercoris DSM 13279]|uniref:Uncharacterized protein n=1 Tax=Collinsella stercoris DSM 13279 TaxID=445975 RepID=B6GDS8_9ACTN|nr:hypothetical protein COLSTE_02261 [Collinsella stercoris DSM 13279]
MLLCVMNDPLHVGARGRFLRISCIFLGWRAHVVAIRRAYAAVSDDAVPRARLWSAWAGKAARSA